jgi:hypothetical protein
MENKQSPKKKLDNQITDKDDSKANNNKISSPKDKVKNPKPNNKSTKKNEIKTEQKKIDDEDDLVLPVKTLKRSNSIKLYKKHKKEQERRNSLKKENEKDTKDKTGDIFNVSVVNGTKMPGKGSKNGKQKKVAFLPNFVTIIDVESYKKFNEENTCKDPFENMEIINGHINIKNNDDEADGKARVLCSCVIY